VNGFGGGVSALESAGPGPVAIYHGTEGIFIAALAIGIAASIVKLKSRRVRVASLLALFVASAAVGGYLFLFAGFTHNGNSAQMGGLFIGTYAMNFLILYYSK
jgi:hypothetical protein